MAFIHQAYKALILLMVFALIIGQMPLKGLTLCIEADGSVNLEILTNTGKCGGACSESYVSIQPTGDYKNFSIKNNYCKDCIDIPIHSETIEIFVPSIRYSSQYIIQLAYGCHPNANYDADILSISIEHFPPLYTQAMDIIRSRVLII